MTKPHIEPRKLNPWLTSQEVESLRIYYTTLPTDNNGRVIGVGNEGVRNDIIKLIAEVKRLQPLEAITELAVKGLKEIWHSTTGDNVFQIAENSLSKIKRIQNAET